MIRVVEAVTLAALAEADEIIDVRSPSEFAEDHVPGAVNLPVLSDAERAEVGTIYVQDDPFKARRLGAALVSRNIALHLEGSLAGRGPAWRPLVYCWRGGQRSGAMATVLSQIGWRTAVLGGGYRTYRRSVVRTLYEGPPLAQVVLLGGPTGVGKTDLLTLLAQAGVQTLDLEALAEHRGSLLGAMPGRAQPSQKMFESRLARAMSALDPAKPVLVEAEASRVGEITLPPMLWSGMRAAPIIELQATIEDRVVRLVDSYAANAEQRQVIAQALDRLPRHIARAEVARWRALLESGDVARLAREMVERHYDPAYGRSLERIAGAKFGTIVLGPSQAIDDALAEVRLLLSRAPD